MPKRARRRRLEWNAASLPDGLLEDRPADWEARGRVLVTVYNNCLRLASQNGGFNASLKNPTSNNVEVFYGIEVWCKQRNLHPHAWIYAVFASLSWRRPVGLRDLLAEGRRKTYETLSDGEWRAIAGQSVVVEPHIPLLADEELFEGAEIAKRNYLIRGQPQLCMINIDITRGHRSTSPVCRECPAQTECAQRTQRLRNLVQ